MTVRTRAQIRDRLDWLRSFLFPGFNDVLKGNRLLFRRLNEDGRRHDQKYTFDLLVRPELEKARNAFRNKSYSDVISIMEPLEDQLGLADKRKLAYARKARG